MGGFTKSGDYFKEKFGDDYYQNIGRKGGPLTRGHIKSRNGYKGGQATKARYGDDYYKRISELGTAAMKRKRNAQAAVTSMTCPLCLTAYPIPDPRVPHVIHCCDSDFFYYPHD